MDGLQRGQQQMNSFSRGSEQRGPKRWISEGWTQCPVVLYRSRRPRCRGFSFFGAYFAAPGAPIRNSPAGTRTNFIPIEFVNRCCMGHLLEGGMS